MAKRRQPRPLSPEEKKLWHEVASTVTPLEKRRAARAKEEAEDAPAPPPIPEPNRPAVSVPRPKPVKIRLEAKNPEPSGFVLREKSPPPLARLDRRTTQRLSRGQMEPEAVLDLHGHTRATADMALSRFLQSARGRGLRLVLVITGKGAAPHARHTLHGTDFYHVPERKAVLRQLVPEWLAGESLRGIVASYQPAHPRHGGGGALYVWLRRKR